MISDAEAVTPAPKAISISEARNQLMQLGERLADEPNTTFEVTRRGEPVLAIMNWELYESIIETLLVLGDGDLMAALQASLADIESGRTYSADEVRERLAL